MTIEKTGAHERLVEAVVTASVADAWRAARYEWVVAGETTDFEHAGVCLCGQQGLRYLYTIENSLNGSTLEPIGSTCIQSFGVADMDKAVAQLRGLGELRELVVAHVPLDIKHLSRVKIEALRDHGVIPAREAGFLRDMFNKRAPITPRQANWANSILCRGHDSVRARLTTTGGEAA